MTQDDELTIVRRTYAKQIVHAARATDPRLDAVLATLRRKQFLFSRSVAVDALPRRLSGDAERRSDLPLPGRTVPIGAGQEAQQRAAIFPDDSYLPWTFAGG